MKTKRTKTELPITIITDDEDDRKTKDFFTKLKMIFVEAAKETEANQDEK